jgi:hypothetical protein
MRIFFNEPRIDLFVADKKRDAVTARDERFRQRNSRGKVSARPAAGDDKSAHSTASAIGQNSKLQ